MSVRSDFASSALLDRLAAVEVDTPAASIMRQLQELITEGALDPGQRLPSERRLAERFGVGRGHVREALRRLEACGVVRTRPQSGTVVEEMAPVGLAGLISNALTLAEPSLEEMTEARVILEVEAARLAALRGGSALATVRQAQETHARAARGGAAGAEEDVLFHLALAGACGNEVVRSLVSSFASAIVRAAHARGSCLEGRAMEATEEHAAIVRAVERGDGEAAAHAMRRHLEMTRARYGARG